MKYSAILAAFAVSKVSGHAIWQQLWVNGVDQASSCVRMPQGGGSTPYSANFPITDVTSNDMRCNANPGKASGNCAVTAGDVLTIEMHQGTSSRSCADEGIGGAHWGPVTVYLSQVSDASSNVGDGNWFKIYQDSWAQNGGDNKDYWGTRDMDFCCGKLSFGLPSSVPAGQYLLRAEALALHAASPSGGYQFYVSCFQLTVSGGSGSLPGSSYMIQFPGGYKLSDPGIGVNIHTSLATYIAPGPSIIPGGASKIPNVATFSDPHCAASSTIVGGGGNGGTSPTTARTTTGPAPTTKSTTTGPAPTTKSTTTAATTRATTTPVMTTATKTTSASGAGQTLYGQCGGSGWTGPTTCASGTCKVLNSYYSQCS